MGDYSSVPGGSEAALAKVKGPAIAIMVLGGLGVLWGLVSIVMNLLGTGMGALGGHGGADRFGAMMSGGIGIASAAFSIILNAVAVFGGLKMSKLESYTMAWVGTAAVAIPCSCCCLVGIPIAIWSAVVLMNDEVKNAFAA
jgi:hypothetical protein